MNLNVKIGNNLKRLEVLLNKGGVGDIILICGELIKMLFLGRVGESLEWLYLLFDGRDMSREEVVGCIKIILKAMYDNVDSLLYKDVVDKTVKFYRGDRHEMGNLVNDMISIGEILSCDWDDCWDRKCLGKNRGLCILDHAGDKYKRGNKPKIVLNKQEKL